MKNLLTSVTLYRIQDDVALGHEAELLTMTAGAAAEFNVMNTSAQLMLVVMHTYIPQNAT